MCHRIFLLFTEWHNAVRNVINIAFIIFKGQEYVQDAIEPIEKASTQCLCR